MVEISTEQVNKRSAMRYEVYALFLETPSMKFYGYNGKILKFSFKAT